MEFPAVKTGYNNAEEQELKKSEHMDAKIQHPDDSLTLMTNVVNAALCVTAGKQHKTTLTQSMTWIKHKRNK